MKKFLLLFGILAANLFTAQITVTEGFEGSAFTQLTPQGWTSKYLNSSSTYVTSSPSFGGTPLNVLPCSGAKLGIFSMSSSKLAWVLQYDSPVVSNGNDINYAITYAANGVGSTGNVDAVFKLEYSTDGSTWIQLNSATFSAPNGTVIPCTSFSGIISGASVPAGSAFSLRMTTENPTLENYYMGLDDVLLSQTPTVAPVCTSVVGPTNGANSQKINVPITWNASTGATNYKVNIGTTPGGSDFANNVSAGNKSYYIPSSNYLYDTTYYVTVFAENAFGATTGCAESSFTTQLIPIVGYFDPSNKSFAIPVDQTFIWSSANLNNPPVGVLDATGYKFSLGTTAAANEVLDMVDVGNILTYKPTANLLSGTQYYYKITTYSSNTSNTTAAIGFSTLCDTATNVPYSEDFESTSGTVPPICSYLQSIEGFSGTNWASNSGNASYGITSRAIRAITSNAIGVNAWFYTQGINLEVGKTYVLTFDYSGGAANRTEKLKVMYGTDYVDTSMTNLVTNLTSIAGGQTAPQSSSNEITVTTSGVYYFGFNAYSDPSQSMIYVDNIKLVDKATLAVSANNTEKLSITPNPFADVIQLSNIKNIKSIEVLDFTGRKLKTITKIESSLNLSQLTKGVYILNILMNDGSSQQMKIIKK